LLIFFSHFFSSKVVISCLWLTPCSVNWDKNIKLCVLGGDL
jgi:hypothetical protein